MYPSENTGLHIHTPTRSRYPDDQMQWWSDYPAAKGPTEAEKDK